MSGEVLMNKKLLNILSVLLLSISPLIVSAQETLLEYHPQDGYVLVTEKGVSSQKVSGNFLNKLKQLRGKKSTINGMAFTPDGKGWTIIANGRGISENIEGGYVAAMKKLQASKSAIKSVAFNPSNWDTQHGFVIIHDKGYTAEGITSKLKEKLDQFSNQPKGIKTVEFTPDGGWTVISDTHQWSRMIQGDEIKTNFIDRIRAAYLDGQKVATASFNPQQYSKLFGWVLITNKGYEGMNIPEKLRQDLLKFSIKALN